MYKSGTGTRGQDTGRCVWGLGTWDLGLGTWDLGTQDEGLEDTEYGTPGHVGRGHETSNTGTQGTWGRLLQKSEVNTISLSS